MSSLNFNAGHLMYEMMQHEALGVPAEIAMRTLCSNIQLHSFAPNRKTFTFKLQAKKGNSTSTSNQSPYLTLQVVKGSLHTLVWSTFARFDDEYALFFHLDDPKLPSSSNMAYLIWSIQGVDAVNSKISAGMIDWFMLRKIQSMLKITSIGLLAFSKLLGRFLISVPNFIKTRRYLPPMPATFMFNYLMVVCHCPFELGIPKLSRLLKKDIDYQTGFSMKRLLQTLIQPNGSGSWLLGYLPVRVASGGYVLQSRYYFEQNISRSTSTDKNTNTNTNTLNDQEEHTEHANTDTTQNTPTPVVSSYSLQCNRLMMETAVRVVELLPHPLGRNELVVVIEFVHNNSWSANTRFVALDAFVVGQAILLAGQPPPPFLSRIDILDCQGWYQRVQALHATNSTANINTAAPTNNLSTTNTNTYLNNSSLTPVSHHQHYQQQQQQQLHQNLSSPPNRYNRRTASLPVVGLDTSGSGTISGLNSMLGSPILDSLSLGMNLSAFSSPQPRGSMNTSDSRFSPNSGATHTNTNMRSVLPTVSMDSYDTHHQPSLNADTNHYKYHTATNYNDNDVNSRLHSAADIILQAATRDMNTSNNNNSNNNNNNTSSSYTDNNRGQPNRDTGSKAADGTVFKDNMSMSNSNNGYSTYDEAEHPQQQQYTNGNQSNEMYEHNNDIINNESDYSSDTSSSSVQSSHSSNSSSSDEHNSTDLFIENIPATSSRSKKKQISAKPNKKKSIKHTTHSNHTNPNSRSYYTHTNNTSTSDTKHSAHHKHSNKHRSYVDTIDFANSCEWGAPCLMKKDRNFYSDLLKALLPSVQSPSMDAGTCNNKAAGYNG
eukprot:gene12824-14806_t